MSDSCGASDFKISPRSDLSSSRLTCRALRSSCLKFFSANIAKSARHSPRTFSCKPVTNCFVGSKSNRAILNSKGRAHMSGIESTEPRSFIDSPQSKLFASPCKKFISVSFQMPAWSLRILESSSLTFGSIGKYEFAIKTPFLCSGVYQLKKICAIRRAVKKNIC